MLWLNTTSIKLFWEHEGIVENTSCISRVSPKMSGVFYHSVIYGLGFFICVFVLWYRGNVAKKKINHAFSVVYIILW